MTLFKLAWHSFRRNLKINLLIIVQTIIALLRAKARREEVHHG